MARTGRGGPGSPTPPGRGQAVPLIPGQGPARSARASPTGPGPTRPARPPGRPAPSGGRRRCRFSTRCMVTTAGRPGPGPSGQSPPAAVAAARTDSSTVLPERPPPGPSRGAGQVGRGRRIRREQHVGQPAHRRPDDLLGEGVDPATLRKPASTWATASPARLAISALSRVVGVSPVDHAHPAEPGEHLAAQPGRRDQAPGHARRPAQSLGHGVDVAVAPSLTSGSGSPSSARITAESPACWPESISRWGHARGLHQPQQRRQLDVLGLGADEDVDQAIGSTSNATLIGPRSAARGPSHAEPERPRRPPGGRGTASPP